ncbi:hypothetical protein [Streptomyces sp. NBC_01236]|uniref:hypothetical protein n=1 Tax=Streptomyces sp. NBC_01236 TaxID=2903789 RepID=UPI002E0E20F9|nr:hypothetical protein OG324_21300 [Streptomyces sp. NBC_01236]
MPALQNKLKRAFWSVDRVLGGQQPPTRFQRFTARHPLGVGMCVGAPIVTLCVAESLAQHDSLGDMAIGAGLGAALGAVFGLTSLGERHRQRRLQRLGLWSPASGEGRHRG